MKLNLNISTSGTANFQSTMAAVRYYGSKAAVDEKIREGAIEIGQPEGKPGYTLQVNDEGRYIYAAFVKVPVFCAYGMADEMLSAEKVPDFLVKIHSYAGLRVVKRGLVRWLIDSTGEILATYNPDDGVQAYSKANKGAYFNIMSNIWAILATREKTAANAWATMTIIKEGE